MAKAHTLISIDPEVLDQIKLKYPGEISKLANEYFKDLLEIDNKNNPNKDKDIEQLEDEIENDATTLEKLEQEIKEFRIKLRLKRENLIFKKEEHRKKTEEETQKKIDMVNSIKASGILSNLAGR